jgi:predicted Zn-ribbon and HTH transcriptional regulator
MLTTCDDRDTLYGRNEIEFFLPMNCPNCGFSVDGRNLPRPIPKCDGDLIHGPALTFRYKFQPSQNVTP